MSNIGHGNAKIRAKLNAGELRIRPDFQKGSGGQGLCNGRGPIVLTRSPVVPKSASSKMPPHSCGRLASEISKGLDGGGMDV
jgi:hypothetical protein